MSAKFHRFVWFFFLLAFEHSKNIPSQMIFAVPTTEMSEIGIQIILRLWLIESLRVETVCVKVDWDDDRISDLKGSYLCYTIRKVLPCKIFPSLRDVMKIVNKTITITNNNQTPTNPTSIWVSNFTSGIFHLIWDHKLQFDRWKIPQFINNFCIDVIVTLTFNLKTSNRGERLWNAVEERNFRVEL